ncbi:MAG: hypothetical protein L6R38_005142 [Xanthoria sp. 2 TBL-2021]|nr:MAG: hypothetical protein L6R38_005142 [Xanthoria sp. 2 TBL-2021]
MASSTPPPPSEPQSFTAMDKEMLDIGGTCQYLTCDSYDFLPFRCESCHGRFCQDHRTEAGHKCAHAGDWAAKRLQQQANRTSSPSSGPKPTVLTATQCSHSQCKTLIDTLISVGVACSTCNRKYCLKHRIPEDHDCKNIIPIGARQGVRGPSQADKARSALGRLKLWGKEKQAAVLPKPKPSTAASRAVALNQLKRTAKGDEKVPLEKRIYLHVEAEANTTTSKLPKGAFWYNKAWSVGRLLDDAARGLQVQNVNNRGGGEEERLRVFHVEGGRLLDFGEKAEDVLAQGNTIVLLRGVGPVSAAA